MADHVEEKEFVLRLEARCVFPEDYEGEADGFEWAKELPGMFAEVVQAAVGAIQRRGRFTVRPRNRGRPADEEVTLVLESTPTD